MLARKFADFQHFPSASLHKGDWVQAIVEQPITHASSRHPPLPPTDFWFRKAWMKRSTSDTSSHPGDCVGFDHKQKQLEESITRGDWVGGGYGVGCE